MKVRQLHCGALGAVVYPGAIVAATVLYASALFVWPPGPAGAERDAGRETAARIEVFARHVAVARIATPFAAVLGFLGGVLRYRMKKGTPEERAGGGGCLQAAMALPLALLYFAIIALLAPLFLLDVIFKTRLWGDGTSGWIPLFGALLTIAGILLGAAWNEPRLTTFSGTILAFGTADFALGWLIFELDRRGALQ